MEMEMLLQFFEDNGYLGIFLWLWLGIFGLPVPNEIISMTVGLASSQKVLNPYLTFLVMLSGIFAALTTSYLLGRFVGRPLLRFFKKRQRFANVLETSLQLMDKYRKFSLLLSYFIPGLRSFVPFLYGFSRLPFRSFALYAYSGAFIWLGLMFSAGFIFGDYLDEIIRYGKGALFIAGMIVVVIAVVYVLWKKRKRLKRENLNEESQVSLFSVQSYRYTGETIPLEKNK